MGLLSGLAGIVYLIGFIWVVVIAFKKSVWWGLGSLFIPFVALIFGFMNWAETKTPMIMYLVGAFVWGFGFASTRHAVI